MSAPNVSASGGRNHWTRILWADTYINHIPWLVFIRIIHFFDRNFSSKKKFFQQIKAVTGFYPYNISLYELAFVHRSASVSCKGTFCNNERLEYLGDAILSSIVAEYLFNKFPDKDEGFLTKMRSKIVNRESLFDLAEKTKITTFVVSNIKEPANKRYIYGDAFEALIGAIYIDRGYRKAQKFVIDNLIHKYLDISQLEHSDTNYKSQLIEWSQKYKKELVFNTTEEVDPLKNVQFVCWVKIDDEFLGAGKGKSKKEAEQNAAERALENLDKPL